MLALLLLAWALKRIIKSPKTNKPREEKSSLLKWFKYGLFVVGILFVISAPTDPSYLTLIAIAGHNGYAGTIVTAHAIWILVSQVPLFIFVGAVLLNKHQGLMGWFRGIQRKYSQQLSLLLTIVITVARLVLLADVITFLVTQACLFG